MTPTREQFKDFIAVVQKAQQKEDNLNKAFSGLTIKNTTLAMLMPSMISWLSL